VTKDSYFVSDEALDYIVVGRLRKLVAERKAAMVQLDKSADVLRGLVAHWGDETAILTGVAWTPEAETYRQLRAAARGVLSELEGEETP
jgi:hypothetical protein